MKKKEKQDFMWVQKRWQNDWLQSKRNMSPEVFARGKYPSHNILKRVSRFLMGALRRTDLDIKLILTA